MAGKEVKRYAYILHTSLQDGETIMFLLREILYMFLLCGLFFIVMIIFYSDMCRLRSENELLQEMLHASRITDPMKGKIVPREQALAFAGEWLRAWNSHDMEAIMSHYSADVEFSSPLAMQVLNEPTGFIRGKDALRAYFENGLSRFPGLHFELIDVLGGVGSVTVYYRGAESPALHSVGEGAGMTVAEVMMFDDNGAVCRALAHYHYEKA